MLNSWKGLINSPAAEAILQTSLPFILLYGPEPSSSGSSQLVFVTEVITVFDPAWIYPSWKYVKENCTKYLGLIKWNVSTNPYLFLKDFSQNVCRMQLPFSHRSHLVSQSCSVNDRFTQFSSTLLFPVDYFSVIILKYNFLPLTKYKNLYFVTLIFISLTVPGFKVIQFQSLNKFASQVVFGELQSLLPKVVFSCFTEPISSPFHPGPCSFHHY